MPVPPLEQPGTQSGEGVGPGRLGLTSIHRPCKHLYKLQSPSSSPSWLLHGSSHWEAFGNWELSVGSANLAVACSAKQPTPSTPSSQLPLGGASASGSSSPISPSWLISRLLHYPSGFPALLAPLFPELHGVCWTTWLELMHFPDWTLTTTENN